MTAAGERPTLSARNTDLLLARFVTKAVVVLLILALVAIVQMFGLGASGRYFLLLAGSLFSVVGLVAYGVWVAHERGQPRRSIGAALYVVAGYTVVSAIYKDRKSVV